MLTWRALVSDTKNRTSSSSMEGGSNGSLTAARQ
jgi:hypothetical protein